MHEPGLVERKLGAAAVELTLAGATVPGNATGPLAIRRGRPSVDSRPEPATLSVVLDTERLAELPELGDTVVVELTPAALNYAGVTADRWQLSYTPNGAGGAYTYVDAGTAGAGTVLRAGWSVEYDLLHEQTDAMVALDLDTSGGVLRDAGLFDQDGFTAHSSARIGLAPGEWRRRRFVIPAGNALDGATLNRWMLAGEQDTAATWTGAVRRPRILDADGRVVVEGWPAGSSPVGGVLYSANTTTDATTRRDYLSDPAVRFRGQLSDVVAEPGTRRRPARLLLTAVGPLARVGQLLVYADQERQEDDGARVQVYFDRASGLDPFVTFGLVDPGTVTLTPRQVDGGALADLARLLDETADDAGGHVVELRTGVVVYRDADSRRNLAARANLRAWEVEAPSSWRQDSRGLVNDLTLVYGVEDANGTRPTVAAGDGLARARFGRYSAQVDTALAFQADAQARATELVGRGAFPSWRIEGLSVELLRTVDPVNLAGLLVADYGDALAVSGLPTTGPVVDARLFVEGATELVERDRWSLDLDVSTYGQTGPPPAWVDVPAGTAVRLFRWRRRDYVVGGLAWQDVDPALSWQGAVSWYTGETTGDSWRAQPADLRWTSGLLADRTWNTY